METKGIADLFENQDKRHLGMKLFQRQIEIDNLRGLAKKDHKQAAAKKKKVEQEAKINSYLDLIARQHMMAEQHQNQIKKEQFRLNLEESKQLKARSDSIKANDLVTSEAAMNAAIMTADLKQFNNAINLEGNPVKRVGQHNLVDMHKFDQRQGFTITHER